jgi:hypothetical protein
LKKYENIIKKKTCKKINNFLIVTTWPPIYVIKASL